MGKRPWTKSQAKRGGQLIKMARAEFGELTKAELWMLSRAATGQFAYCNFNNDKDPVPKPDNPDIKRRTIQAACLSWLLTEPDARECIHHEGVQVFGALILGQVDLLFAQAPMNIALFSCNIPQGMDLQHACIRSLFLNGSHSGPISAGGLRTSGSVSLQETTINGEVRFLGADIDGNLECDGATLDNAGGKALNADGITVKGGVFLRDKFSSTGEVRFLGADIGGDLDCTGATMDNEGGKALNAQNTRTKGSVFIQGYSSQGGLDFTRATVEAYCIVAGVKEREQFDISLQSASIGHLRFSKNSWPIKGNLILDGLTYERLDDADGVLPHERIHWVKLQPQSRGKFRPQPYEQLAKSLAKAGHAEEARDVLMAKADDYLKFSRIPLSRRLFYMFMGTAIGYGYRPMRALFWMCILLFFSFGIFYDAAVSGIIVHSKDMQIEMSTPPTLLTFAHYPKFQPFIYSLDIIIPLVDLHQEYFFKPLTDLSKHPDLSNVPPTAPLVVCCFRWFTILSGWVLTTLFVVGLTGLVRGDPSRE